MKKSLVLGAFIMAIACVGAVGLNYFSEQPTENGLDMENVEALSGTDVSGAKCPRGCRDFGWGVQKILECDCNYDHFSCCNSWGC